MKKIFLVFITIILAITNLYSQNTQRAISKNDFKKLESITKELSKYYSKRFKIADYFIKKANEKGGELRLPDKIDKLNLSNNFDNDSLRIEEYFSYQLKISGKIVKSLMLLEQYSNLEKDKKTNKQLDKLELIESKLKDALKRYNQLIDENQYFQNYPRFGGKKENEANFEINFD